MAIKNFPDISPDAGATFGIQSNNTEFRSALNNNVQHQAMPGDRWSGTMGFSNRAPEQAQKIKAFLTSLGGSRGRFYLTPPDAYQNGTLSGTPTVDGAVAINSEILPTAGWDISQSELIKAGDYVEVNGELKMITEDAVSDSSGDSILFISPPLREALAGGESITVDNPKGVFYLDSNSQSWDLNPFGVNTFAISYTEDVN